MPRKFVWDVDEIPNGREAYTESGWVRKCRGEGCDVTWDSGEKPFPLFVREQAAHEATHPGLMIPGWNVGILG